MLLNKEQSNILSKVISMPLRYTLNIEHGKILISSDGFFCSINLGEHRNEQVTVNTEYFLPIKKSIRDDSEILIQGSNLLISNSSNTTSILLEAEHKKIVNYDFDYSGIFIQDFDYIFNLADKNLNLDVIFQSDCIIFYQCTSIKHIKTTIYTDTKSLVNTSIQISSETLRVLKTMFITGCFISIDTNKNCIYFNSPSNLWFCRVPAAPKGRVGEISFPGSEIRIQAKSFTNAITDTKHLTKDDLQNFIKLRAKKNKLYIDASYGNAVNTSCEVPIENNLEDDFEIFWSKNMASWCVEFIYSGAHSLILKTNSKIISILQKYNQVESIVTTPLKAT